MSDNDLYYTVAEAALELNVGPRAIQRRAKRGRIPGAKMSDNRAGRQYYLIPKDWVQAELKKNN